ncbi:hypothetical protein H6G54_15875 [Anabaena cylindrica FACHB-243]|uniref:Uncharacterized protein n=1 Tax=Anabaena cylindrica (strain ATCC 27899 / PCC 7122) TaxID=272123 RepID=K9ZIA3_ANACC|nr:MULTISPECIES: hypothetical protein [Anabaena]AFZ58075.1 hypothetical protein Anacy_2635 [Anabaena cylindrica PCC 7122]MBD2419150.1 hypothetical protein [Anabaena cylindrica FACHB-243]MBY5284029.1 hypothetical protein [Anabaena sp. CCAP 1446/1C]MBY5306834.1 hypothetical protein [Anabaena sp. CCAP 1446/1C]MCM2409621.1 hypothetical protein [Anabaena sp. CCAP 1446/1C]
MPKTLMIDVIMQQLDALSVEELLEVRAKVNALIPVKSSRLANIENAKSHFNEALERSALLLEVSKLVTSNECPDKWLILKIRESFAPVVELEVNTIHTDNSFNSLEKFIELVDEWMADESDYDQKTYPQIEAALNQNRLVF